MNTSNGRVLLGFGLLACFSACSAAPATRNTDSPAQFGGPAAGATSGAPLLTGAQPNAAAGGAAPVAGPAKTTPGQDSCAANLPFKGESCICRGGETAACWTGPAADRNIGACHDGVQTCSGDANAEFSVWGPCVNEEHNCGHDAGVPEQPGCPCIPGAVIQCSEDCSVAIFCSLTATKVCQPDGTWSVCRETPDAPVSIPGVQCRNMLHGCAGILAPEDPKMVSTDGEVYVGDCSTQFKCGHAPELD